jgi:copper(I)-binding protein
MAEPAVGRWEPYDGRLSRTVLPEAGGETPPAYYPPDALLARRAFIPVTGATLRSLILGLTALTVVMTAAGAAAPAAAPTLTVANAWIRWLPAQLPAAGYATLRNLGAQPLTLIGASTPDYGAVMIHESRNRAGVEEMLPVETILVKPQAEIAFAPGGYHLMLMKPKRALQPGDRVLLTFHFAGGQSLQTQFEVRKPDGSRAERPAGSDATQRQ